MSSKRLRGWLVRSGSSCCLRGFKKLLALTQGLVAPHVALAQGIAGLHACLRQLEYLLQYSLQLWMFRAW